MTKLYTIFLVAFMSLPLMSNAQLPPDFTVTDMDGNTHNLHTYLNNGYTVILDFWATWCEPCIKSSPVIDEIHELYGFDGDDTYVIFSVEYDGATSNEQDIVDKNCFPNPIILQSGFTPINPNDYDFKNSIPYFVVICPDGSYGDIIGQISTSSQLLSLATGCSGQKAPRLNDAKLMPMHCEDLYLHGESSFTPVVTLINMGSNALTDAKIQVSMDGNVVGTYEWFGNLPHHVEQEITLNEIANISKNGALSDHTLEIEIIEMNGGTTEDNLSNNMFSSKLAANPKTELDLTLEIVTDNYGSETAWEVTNSAGTIIANGPTVDYNTSVAGINYAGNTAYTETFSVAAEDYYFITFYDDFGDGICCDLGTGSYTLSDVNGVALMGGEYGLKDVQSFHTKTTIPSAIEEPGLLQSIEIFPNPADNYVSLSFMLNRSIDAEINMINTIGQTIYSIGSSKYVQGRNEVTIPTGDLSTGIYFINIESSVKTLTKKLIINR